MSRASEIEDDAGAADIPIYRMPGYLIRRMHQASQAVFDAEVAAAGFDLTPVQFAALTVIAARPGLDQATVANAIAFDRATTGGVIDRLEGKGLVRRIVAEGDRRARRLYVEPAGRATLATVTPIVERSQARLLAGLAQDEALTLLRLIGKVIASVESREPPRR